MILSSAMRSTAEATSPEAGVSKNPPLPRKRSVTVTSSKPLSRRPVMMPGKASNVCGADRCSNTMDPFCTLESTRLLMVEGRHPSSQKRPHPIAPHSGNPPPPQPPAPSRLYARRGGETAERWGGRWQPERHPSPLQSPVSALPMRVEAEADAQKCDPLSQRTPRPAWPSLLEMPPHSDRPRTSWPEHCSPAEFEEPAGTAHCGSCRRREGRLEADHADRDELLKQGHPERHLLSVLGLDPRQPPP